MAEVAVAPAAVRARGWAVIARKELADHFRSVRFAITAVLILLTGLASVYSVAGAIRGVAERATPFPMLFLRLFTESQDPLPSFIAFVGLLAPLLGIAFGFDAVNGERAQGTLPRLLAQPIHRDDVINGKFVAGLVTIALFLVALVVFVGTVGIIRIGVVPSLEELARLALFVVVTLVYVGFWLAFATLCSVWLRRAATSALAAIATWLVLALFAGLLVRIIASALAPLPDNPTFEEQVRNARLQLTLSRLSPSTLYGESVDVILNPVERRGLGFLDPLQALQLQQAGVPNPVGLLDSVLICLPLVLAMVALTVVTFAAAYVSFMRQEVRA